MATLLRITDWNERFENNRTRELKRLDWVPVPNKWDGDGYTELVADHPDGAAHFAVWIIILELASKCGERGTLLRSNGIPHDAKSISRMTRMPEPLVAAAIPRLMAIGWIEAIAAASDANVTVTNGIPVPQVEQIQPLTESRQNPAPECEIVPVQNGTPPHPTEICTRERAQNGTEWNRTEKNGKERNVVVVADADAERASRAREPDRATATAATASPPLKKPGPGPDPEPEDSPDDASELVSALSGGHCRHGPVGPLTRAVRAARERLARAPDRAAKAREYRKRHQAHQAWWQAHPGGFVPHLWRWFADGDCEYDPPSEEQAVKRKEPVSETMRLAMELQAELDAKAARKAASG